MAASSRSTTIAELRRMFSNLDATVIESVLAANHGQVDTAIDQLLTMSIDTENHNNIQQVQQILFARKATIDRSVSRPRRIRHSDNYQLCRISTTTIHRPVSPSLCTLVRKPPSLQIPAMKQSLASAQQRHRRSPNAQRPHRPIIQATPHRYRGTLAPTPWPPFSDLLVALWLLSKTFRYVDGRPWTGNTAAVTSAICPTISFESGCWPNRK